jgi:tRNA nucleotidyltransferase (CCA-adding enzyme)
VPARPFERLRALPAVAAVADEPGVWIVGGAVRDALRGGDPHEVDLVVVGDAVAVARRAAARLGGQVLTHERFGTATVRAGALDFDLATAREETYPRPGALPEVRPAATIEADLGRRDFGVNAIAVDVALEREAAWPGAREDLDAGVLRVLHDGSFLDDPTRLLRMARYAGRLGFEPEPGTAALAEAAVAGGALTTVSGERLGAELRLLAREPQPAALEALARFGLGAALLPGFRFDAALVRRALALAPPDARADLIGLGAVLSEPAPGGPTRDSTGTHAAGSSIEARLDALGFPAAERRILAACARSPTLAASLRATMRPSEVRRVVQREPVEAVALAAARGAGAAERWLTEWRHLQPEITGTDLLAAGLSGPAIGAGLEAATAALLDGEAPDREAQLAVALGASPPPAPRA